MASEKSIDPFNNENQAIHTHKFTARIHPLYDEYLSNLAYRCGMNKMQLIRLLIHLSPWNEEFQNAIEPYMRKSRQKYVVLNGWDLENDMWKWAK